MEAKEEKELFQKMKEGGPEAEKARAKLIEAFMPMVKRIVKKIRNIGNLNSSLNFDDLVSVGKNALIEEAIRKFDPEKGYRFSTYAYPIIQFRMYDYLNSERFGGMKASRKLIKLAKSVVETHDYLMKRHGREPTVEKIARYLEIEKSKVEAALEFLGIFFESIDEKRKDEKRKPEDADGTTNEPESPGPDSGKISISDNIKEIINCCLKKLRSEDQRRALIMKYWEGLTNKVIAQKMGKTVDAVKQIIQRAKREMRELLPPDLRGCSNDILLEEGE